MGHNNDPGEGASVYAVSTGNTYAPTMVTVCFPIIVSLNPLTHTAKVDLGIVIRLASLRVMVEVCLSSISIHLDERPAANQWTVSTISYLAFRNLKYLLKSFNLSFIKQISNKF